MANPFGFLQEVRSEVRKVTWPTRRETMITTCNGFHHGRDCFYFLFHC